MNSLHKIKIFKGFFLINHIRGGRKRIRQVINDYPFLENGHYHIVFGNLISVVNKKYARYTEITRRPLFKECIISLLNPYIWVHNHQYSSKYQAFFLTMSGDIKFIDYSNGLMLTIYNSLDKRKQMLDRYLYFENILKTTFIENNNEGILERYIQAEARKAWSNNKLKKVYEKILYDITYYFEKVHKTGICKQYRFFLEDYKDIRGYFSQIFPDEDLSRVLDRIGIVPVCTIHGDLHMDNVLVNGDEIYYIDFEDTREDIFFYDIFNVMFVEYTNYNSVILLDLYINGDASVMSLVETMFRSIGYVFIENLKLEYVILFVLQRLQHDISHLGKVDSNHSKKNETIVFLLDRYRSFIEYIVKGLSRKDV